MKNSLKDFQNLTISPCQQMAIKGGDGTDGNGITGTAMNDYIGTTDVIDG